MLANGTTPAKVRRAARTTGPGARPHRPHEGATRRPHSVRGAEDQGTACTGGRAPSSRTHREAVPLPRRRARAPRRSPRLRRRRLGTCRIQVLARLPDPKAASGRLRPIRVFRSRARRSPHRAPGDAEASEFTVHENGVDLSVGSGAYRQSDDSPRPNQNGPASSSARTAAANTTANVKPPGHVPPAAIGDYGSTGAESASGSGAPVGIVRLSSIVISSPIRCSHTPRFP